MSYLQLPSDGTPGSQEVLSSADSSPIGSLLLLTRKARQYEARTRSPVKAKQAWMTSKKETPQQIVLEVVDGTAKEQSNPADGECSSPLGTSLRLIRRARAFGGSVAAEAATLKGRDLLQDEVAEDDLKVAPAVGLSQAELDKLTGATQEDAAIESDEEEQGFQLTKARRARAFIKEKPLGEPSSRAGSKPKPSGFSIDDDTEGLPQAELDTLAVEQPEDDVEGSECEEGGIEACLRRSRRARAFGGRLQSEFYAEKAMAESYALSGSSRSGGNSMSQAALDTFVGASSGGTSSEEEKEESQQEANLTRIRRLRAFCGDAVADNFARESLEAASQGSTRSRSSSSSGISQTALDELSIRAPQEDSTGPVQLDSPISQEALLLHRRRLRAFLGSDVAARFAKKAMDQAMGETTSQQQQTVDTGSTCTPTPTESGCKTRFGKSQFELNRLCIGAPDLDVDLKTPKTPSCASPHHQVASPSRRRLNSKESMRKRDEEGFFSSPIRGGA
eukprot:TRINITY_DN30826_c0_g1_i1.p1 TRINITY_DN30826_c0_g1~~TRINITY_DN30826_c0_g1_i1.p1  ORF type:complete len:505 (-),score=134.76 TRINITY_DN30826_c0_g1_i1:143-1657(-)